jgi:hypothetical protein
LSWADFRSIPGYRFLRERHLPKKNGYALAQPIHGTGSVKSIVIEHRRRAGWFAPFRITVIPRDATGLREEDLRTILELLTDPTFSLLEIAFDFPIWSVIDVDYVRRFGLFGKTWSPAGWNPTHQKYGGTRGSKIVKVYAKWEIDALRVELELRSRFLRRHGITDIFDFGRLAEILVGRHIYFGRMNTDKLIERLQKFRSAKQQNILEHVANGARSLWETLRYLRQKVGLENTRRLLTPIHEVNRVIDEASLAWAGQWPKTPARLGAQGS